MRLPFRATCWPQESPLDLPAIASGSVKPENVLNADGPPWRCGIDSSLSRKGPAIVLEATTIAFAIVFQGRVLRAHFDWDAPPVHGATIVAGQILPIGAHRNCAP